MLQKTRGIYIAAPPWLPLTRELGRLQSEVQQAKNKKTIRRPKCKMESPQQHQHGGESIVLHTFYTGRAKISTKTFERGVQPEKNCGNFRTKSVNDQPGDPTQPRQMETSPEAGQSILVQPLAGAEPLYSPPQRTAAHGAASGDGSMGLHRCRTEPVLVAGDDCGPLASGISRKETALHFEIYRYIKKSRFPKITPKTHLRRRGKRILPRNSNYNSIQPERIIPQWPEEIRQRARIGDWEGDTVYGGVGKGLLVTQVDRKSRFLPAGLLAKRDASLTKAVICQLLRDVPVKSISLDNGSEFSEFKALEAELHTLVYFAEPHKPWQRGTNENTNGLLRFFFPKGCDFHAVSQDFVDSVVDLINSRPRKCLGWRSPAEVFHNLGVALA